jgi:hypothetical protein
MASGAMIRVYATTDLSFVHLDQAYSKILADLPSQPGLRQVSCSYGLGETFSSSSQNQTDAQYFASLSAAGVTVFVSSGDGGSSPSSDGQSHNGPVQAEVPSTDPNATQPVSGTATSTGGNSAATATPAAGTAAKPPLTTTGAAFPNTVAKPGTNTNASSPAKGALELQIHVSRATWLSIQADGKEASTETLRDSATKTVVAQDRIVITTGNSVDVTCNGKSLGILGADNKRSQLRITADCKVN